MPLLRDISVNKNDFIRTSIALVAVFLFSACSDNSTEQTSTELEPKLVKMTPVREIKNEQNFEFPAEVSAVKTVDMRFEVSGRLVEENLRAGNEVNKGDVLAKLDPEPFQRRVKEQTTRLNQAERELKRVRQLIEKQLVPQSALDDAQTAYELAEIAVNNAKQDLAYTQIMAPFKGQVAQRIVDNNSYVQAGEVIASIQDRSQVYFNIHVPERLFTLYASREGAKVEGSILARPTDWVDLSYVEHSAQPDPITQTYKVVFSKPADTENPITPGARAKVKVHLDQEGSIDQLIIPYTALFAEQDAFFVWRYNPQNQQVNKVAVSVVSVRGDYAGIKGDLTEGDKIVSAGVSKMREGMRVVEYLAE
jgi:RND family efflux transporter MFP subunit